MAERADCPDCFLVKPSNLRGALIDIIERYNLVISNERLLSVCGKCGGDIIAFVKSTAPESTRWPADQEVIPQDTPVFVCQSCSQLYW